MYFKDGWQEFLRDNSLIDKEFLLFSSTMEKCMRFSGVREWISLAPKSIKTPEFLRGLVVDQYNVTKAIQVYLVLDITILLLDLILLMLYFVYM